MARSQSIVRGSRADRMSEAATTDRKGRQMFRTQTGQTGRSAYIYELTRMANKLAAVEREFAATCQAISDDLAPDLTLEVPIPSEQFPDATMPADTDYLKAILGMSTIRDANDLSELFARIKDSSTHQWDYQASTWANNAHRGSRA